MSEPSPYTTHVAVPLPDDETARAVIGAAYDPSTVLNVTKMLAGTEDLYEGVVGLVKAVFTTDGISPKQREMLILRVAKVLSCPYEWQANAQMARNAGLTETEIAAAASEGPVTGVDPELVLLCAATDELSRTSTLSDDTLAAMLARFDSVLTRKLIVTIGWFTMLSKFLNACRVPLETTDKIGTKTSPL